MVGEVRCDWDGFAWVWDFGSGKWLLDVLNSGGPPSPHEKSPQEPPYKVINLLERD